MKTGKLLTGLVFAMAAILHAEPLKIAYSDWPGWVAWQVGLVQGGRGGCGFRVV